MKCAIIIAPHPDDEIIGAFDVLHSGKDVFFDSVCIVFVTGEKKDSVEKYYDELGILTQWLNYDEMDVSLVVTNLIKYFSYCSECIKTDRTTMFFVPNISDNHILHKCVNIAIKASDIPSSLIRYYSVSMCLSKPSANYEKKRELLYSLYKEQFIALKSDKYFLFENVIREDFRRFIHCGFKIEGYHSYPSCSGKYKSDLIKRHNHTFVFKVKLETFHDDREIEFLEFRDEIARFAMCLSPFSMPESCMSCERMAREIMEYIFRKYPGREVSVSVYEDDLNGAEVSWGNVSLPEVISNDSSR